MNTGFRPTRADWAQAALIAALLFALYAATSPRTVAAEDDGLFVLSSYYRGIEHPPGYPLFTLIGHLFTYLPFGSIAYRVHLASAFFGALSGAAAWLCSRTLVPGRLPAYLAAFALGLTPVFWSQAIIAEVYTLNAFFFLMLAYLGLQAEPRRVLPWMALLFGLSLSNHYPLMLLMVPAFAVLLWPARREMFDRLGLLLVLVVVGLLPYVWMVRRSWDALPINFDGPLETLPEIWFFVSRAGYAGIDHSASAELMDRLRFFRFLGAQFFVQFALVGTALAAAGFAVQWRMLGRRVSTFLALAFLMSSAVLIFLLGFDYSAVYKHMFHVYVLPAYAVGALWMALGFAWAVERYALRRRQAVALCAAVLALMAAVGARSNLLASYDWPARYAHAVLRTLPADAVVFAQGDPDLTPLAYFLMVENWRPDVTLYQAKGLVLGNRLFHPLRTDEQTQQRVLRETIDEEKAPVAFTLGSYSGYARRDRWLYSEVDKSSTDPHKFTVDIPEEAVRFFEESVLAARDPNAWVAFFQAELRRRYATLLASALPREGSPPPRERRHLELLAQDFHGALGIAEGLMLHKDGYAAGAVARFLDKARELMPSDAGKEHMARFFYLRGSLRADLQDPAGAIRDFENALFVWPNAANMAIGPLEELHRRHSDPGVLQALQTRLEQLKRPRR
jgi:4-amino-4-deoxy-L-arabinose transferase-like glycosyltransferase